MLSLQGAHWKSPTGGWRGAEGSELGLGQTPTLLVHPHLPACSGAGRQLLAPIPSPAPSTTPYPSFLPAHLGGQRHPGLQVHPYCSGYSLSPPRFQPAEVTRHHPELHHVCTMSQLRPLIHGGTCPRGYSGPPDPGLPLPSVPSLGDKGVRGQEGHSVILGKSPPNQWPWLGNGRHHPSLQPSPQLCLRQAREGVPGQRWGLTAINQDRKDAAGRRKGTDKARAREPVPGRAQRPIWPAG